MPKKTPFNLIMDIVVNLLSLLGALAMFLYGMSLLSGGLEKFAGDKLASVLSIMTKNRVTGVLTGVLVTMILQSSSATTIIVVSLVTSGVMTLRQSIGVIMGANIGTTATVWLISAVGFQIEISSLALPLLAFTLPMFFVDKSKVKSFSQSILGFCFLFIGLSFLQSSATNLNIGEHVANMLSHFNCESYTTILLFVLIGTIVTAIVQSSAVTMAITLMLFDMNIPGFGFYQAAALAMGQNIGTTATAVLGSLAGNKMARRAAMAHMLFNVIGVVIILPIFYYACDCVSWFVTDVLHSETNALFKLSAFHTAFNIFNTLLLISFVPQIENICYRIIPKTDDEEDFRLKYIPTGMITSTSEIALSEVRNEIITFAERCKKMFAMVKNMTTIEKESEFNRELGRVTKYEGITDKMEVEIANYLTKVGEAGQLTKESKRKIPRMMKLVSELESIGDSCYNLGRTLNHKRETNLTYTPEQYANITKMFSLIDKAIENMLTVLSRQEGTTISLDVTMEIERDINSYRKMLKERSLIDISENKYSYQLGVSYMDFINECEHLGDYIVNVVQASNYNIA